MAGEIGNNIRSVRFIDFRVNKGAGSAIYRERLKPGQLRRY
jgi:hypothetical protein